MRTDGHGGLVFGGYSHTAREGCLQALRRPTPTWWFEHLESVEKEDEATRTWQRSHWIAAVGTHPLGFINSGTNILTTTRDNYGFIWVCFLACWGNAPPSPLFPFTLGWATHPLPLLCWAGSAASMRGNRFVNCLEINRQAIRPTQANLTLYAQHCIPLGWKSSFIPS